DSKAPQAQNPTPPPKGNSENPQKKNPPTNPTKTTATPPNPPKPEGPLREARAFRTSIRQTPRSTRRAGSLPPDQEVFLPRRISRRLGARGGRKLRRGAARVAPSARPQHKPTQSSPVLRALQPVATAGYPGILPLVRRLPPEHSRSSTKMRRRATGSMRRAVHPARERFL